MIPKLNGMTCPAQHTMEYKYIVFMNSTSGVKMVRPLCADTLEKAIQNIEESRSQSVIYSIYKEYEKKVPLHGTYYDSYTNCKTVSGKNYTGSSITGMTYALTHQSSMAWFFSDDIFGDHEVEEKEDIKEVKFPLKVHVYGKGYDYYDLTEEQMEEKCCIAYDGLVFWKFSVPPESREVSHLTLYDIWNYESTPWWEWPENLRKIMHTKVPKSQR